MCERVCVRVSVGVGVLERSNVWFRRHRLSWGSPTNLKQLNPARKNDWNKYEFKYIRKIYKATRRQVKKSQVLIGTVLLSNITASVN